MCKYHDIYKDCNICIYMMNRYVDKLRILLCSVHRRHCIAPKQPSYQDICLAVHSVRKSLYVCGQITMVYIFI